MDLELSRAAAVTDRVSQVAGFAAAAATSDTDRPASSSRTPHPTQDYSSSVADALTRLVEQQMRAQYEEHRMKIEALQARMESELLEKQAALLRALRSGSSFAVPEADIDPCSRVPCSSRVLDNHLQPPVTPQPAKRAASGRFPRLSEKDPGPSLVHVIRPRSTLSPTASDTKGESTDTCRTADMQGSDDAAPTCDSVRIASSRVGSDDAAVTCDPDRTASPRVENVCLQDARDLPEAGDHSSNGSDGHDIAPGAALGGLTSKPLLPCGTGLDRCCAVNQPENPPGSGHSENAITPTSSDSYVQPLLVQGCSTFALSELDSDRLCGVGRDNLDSGGEDELASQSIHVPVPTAMVSVVSAALESTGVPDGESLSSVPTDWSRLLVHSDSEVAALPPISDSKISLATSVSTGAMLHHLVDKIARPAGAAVSSSGTCPSWVASSSAADLSALRGRAYSHAAEQELLVAVPDLDTGKQSAPPVKHTIAVAAGNSNVKDWPTLGSPAARDRCVTSTIATVAEPPAAHLDLLPVPASVQLCDPSALRTPDEDDDLSTSLRLSLRQKHARQLANLRCYYEEELDSLRRHMSSHEFIVMQEPYRKLLSDNEQLQKRVRLLDEELTRAYKYITSVDKQMAALESTVKAFTSESKQAFSEDSKADSSAKRTLKASQEALQASRKDQELLRTSLRKLRAENQFLREEASRLRRELKQTSRAPAVVGENIEVRETSLCLGAANQLYDVSGTDLPSRSATALLTEPRHRHIVGASAAREALFSGASASQETWQLPTEQASGSLPSCGSTSTSVSYSTLSSHTSVESPQPSVRPATKERVGSLCGTRPPRPFEASPCGRQRGDAAGRALSPSRSLSSVRRPSGGSAAVTTTTTMHDDRGIRGTAVGGSADDEEEEEEEDDDSGGGVIDDDDEDSEREVGRSKASLPIAADAAEQQPVTATTAAGGTSDALLRRHWSVAAAAAASRRAAVVAPSAGCAVVTSVRAAADSAAAAAARSCPITPAVAAAPAGISLESQRLSASGAGSSSSSSSSKRRSSGDLVLPASDVAAAEPSQRQQQQQQTQQQQQQQTLQQQTRQQLQQQQQLQTRHLSCPLQQAAFSSQLQPGSLLHAYNPVATTSPDHKRRSSGSDSDARLGSRARSGRSQLSALGDARTSGGDSSAIRASSCSSTSNCPSSSAASEVQLPMQKQQLQEQQLRLLPPSHSCSDPVSLSSVTGSAVGRSSESVGSSPNSAKNGDVFAALSARSTSAATSAHFEKRSPSEKKAKATQTHPSAADVLKQQQQHQQRGSPARRSLHASFASSGSGAQLSAVNHHSDQDLNSGNGTTTQHNNHSTTARSSGAASEVHHTGRPAAGITTTAAACTLERVQLTHDLETRLDELLSEKRELEAVLSRMPISGGTLQDRLRKEEVEQQLDSVDRNLGSVRIALRRYKAL